jgi:endoglucanase Acf2
MMLLGWYIAQAQVVPVGNGSYTTTFPGTDQAGRNTFPSGSPQLSAVAASKPVPTNDWWSNFIKVDHGGQGFNYPLSFRSKPEGIVVNYTVPPAAGPTEYRQPMGDVEGIIVGVDGLSASRSTAANHSDWTVTLNWNGGGKDFNSTMGIGMPFVYFTKGSADIAKVAVKFNAEAATISGNKIIIRNNYNGANYVVFGPAGSVWSGSGGIFTSTLNGKNYWSMAMLPFGVDVNTAIAAFEPYAYVFPGNTQVAWAYNETTGVVRTTFSVTPDVKEGTSNTVLQGLLPHQWSRLAADSPQPSGYTYATVRGTLKMLASNTFIVANKFSGILPTLPNLAKYSNGFDPGALYKKVDQLKSDGLPEWTDSYNEGQNMNRLIQAAHIAHQIGHTAARDQLINTVKARLEDWFKAEQGEVAFLFYYNDTWKALLGYPAGHRQDENLNDHHFHWGYFIHAAAAIEQYQPGWAAQWGPMVNLLVRDAASPNRNDAMFPFLRNFSPYAGHSWANGFATEPFGNDQESTSESMQFNSSLIHWGTITGNTEIRNLGIYLYTTEQSSVEEYWFDINRRTFQPAYQHEMVARIWGGGYDNGTWWTSDIAASYGIQLYPIHGGALYMGHNTAYVQRVWNGMTAKTPVLQNTPNDNLWYDTYWSYLSFLDPAKAIELYNAYPSRNVKVGMSDAQTYHWLHTMNAMGQVMEEVTANYPIAAVFDKAGVKTYVAYNYGSSPITVAFSDGYSLPVPARSMATNRDINVGVSLSVNTQQVPANGSVNLTAAVTGSGVTKVEFYRNTVLLGSDDTAPYSITAGNLQAGLPNFYAKAYVGTNANVSNVITVQVGSQVPYSGTPIAIPGAIEAGNYDAFEGGSGQGVSYNDATPWNEGGFRPSEAVDAGTTPNEGNTVGWIDAGEWLEYTVNVAQAGNYNVNIRYTSGNATGGGPFWFEREDGTKISGDITLATNDVNWTAYTDKAVTNVTLAAGRQVIRVKMGSGGFNLGRMTFTYAGGSTNIAPTVNLTSTANNTAFTAPASITLTADAADTDGTISKVEFYNGTTLIGTDTSSPYSVTWNNVAAGTYSLTAKATDNSSGVTTSAAVSVVINGTTSPNLALNKSTTVSSTEITTTPGSAAVDGNATTTRWSSERTDPQWIYVDLGATYDVNRVKITWEGAYGKDFQVQISANASTWSNLKTVTDNTALVNDYTGLTGTGRYVRIYGTARGTVYGYSIYELEVYGTANKGSGNGTACTSTVANGDYSYQVSTAGGNVSWTFTPLAPIAGSTMAILYVRTGTGDYTGYNMTASGSSFTYSGAFASGAALSFYFTYQVGNTVVERNSSANPHAYTVGTTCAARVAVKEPLEIKQSNAFRLYPNPVAGTLTIESAHVQFSEFRITDMRGMIVRQQTLTAGQTSSSVDVTSLAKGVYLLYVYSAEGVSIQRFVKQ